MSDRMTMDVKLTYGAVDYKALLLKVLKHDQLGHNGDCSKCFTEEEVRALIDLMRSND